VDGSCNAKTFKKLSDAGTEMYVVGSSGLFSLDPDLSAAYDKMLRNFKEAAK
jgi:D-allulose-6-phosphate 3-epimerase